MIDDSSGDSEIMQHTVRMPDGSLQIQIREERFRSEAGLPEKLSIAMIEGWCNAVRQRAKDLSEMVPRARKDTPPPPPPSTSDDPVDFVRRNYTQASGRLLAAQAEIEVAQALYDKWSKLMKALDLDEESEDES